MLNMTIFNIIILAIVEGITEYLPISSTGHMILVSNFLNIVQNDQLKIFEVSIQVGVIAAMFVIYWRKFLDLEIIKKVIIAFLPSAVVGFIFFKTIKNLLYSQLVVVFSLILGGLILIATEMYYKKNTSIKILEIDYKNALFIGFAQVISMIPGVSRSGATIVCGLLLNIERKVVAEFTFLLAVPTMCAATIYSLYKSKDLLTADYLSSILLGIVVAFITAFIVIKIFLDYIKKYDFIPFGVYRIILGVVVLLTLI